MTESPPAAYLDPEVLAKVADLHILVKTVMEGVIAGLHRSPHKGSSVEFAEFKEYSPGDDIRHIDWKAFGKSDKYYVKQFEDETNLQAIILLDESGSMGFGSKSLTKIQYAAFLSACLAYLFIRQGDAAGLFLYGEEPGTYLPPRAHTGHLDDLFQLLDGVRIEGGTALLETLKSVAERAQRRGILLIVSDLLDVDEETMHVVRVLRSRNFEVTFFHVLDREELSFPYEGLTRFEGLENEGILLVDPDDIRDFYLGEFGEYLSFVKTEAQRARAEYIRAVTDQPLEKVLLHFLAVHQTGMSG